MNLLSCQSISKAFSSKVLFEEISLTLSAGDQVGMIGPNGSGKSTLLKILAGIESPDTGLVTLKKGMKAGYVPQDAQFPDQSIEEVLLSALKDDHALDAYEKDTLVAITLSRMGFLNPQERALRLSGGWKKRLDIARQLVQKPDILLLDEPTNHLDLEGVMWLEKFLLREAGTFLVISHDRAFLENITSKIIELNKSYPKGLFAVDGSYTDFLEKRALFLEGQQQTERSMASKLRREIEWLKQGVKARTTKSRSRIQEAHRLESEFQGVKERNAVSQVTVSFSATERETKKLIAVYNISKKMNERELFSKVTFTLSPKMRLGIVGKNGSGKTTLLKMLAQEGTPDSGSIKFADGIKVVYFDQQRMALPQDISLKKALAPDGERVIYRGQSIHVNSWCQKFLFDKDRLELPVRELSGGEKARILIARLMLEPADVLLLDEPTNDLDLPTLELLEENLTSFPGAVVLISHDRFLLDRVSNQILGLGTGSDTELFADLSQWQAFQESAPKAAEPKKAAKAEKESPKVKLPYHEKRELDQMEEKISQEEQKLSAVTAEIEKTADPASLERLCSELSASEKELERLYSRWQELLAKQG
ncbi:MAG: putative tylosin resistance protein [Chlamydiales bacterium]|jgi:ATP-binding cassette subfamily F protein uup|nr:putative tylosin resistance protein [Chlamydiales bacterium]